jgi:hypothetical protein
LTNGTGGSAALRQTDDSNCSCCATTGTVSVPTTADTDEVDETSIANGTVSATGTIIDNNAPTVATITPASATEGSDVVFDFTLSNPSVDTLYFVLTNGTAGSADYTTTTLIVTPAGATTGTVSVPTTADTIDEVDETSALLMELFRLRVHYRITMRLLWQQRSLLLRLLKDLMWY